MSNLTEKKSSGKWGKAIFAGGPKATVAVGDLSAVQPHTPL